MNQPLDASQSSLQSCIILRISTRRTAGTTHRSSVVARQARELLIHQSLALLTWPSTAAATASWLSGDRRPSITGRERGPGPLTVDQAARPAVVLPIRSVDSCPRNRQQSAASNLIRASLGSSGTQAPVKPSRSTTLRRFGRARGGSWPVRRRRQLTVEWAINRPVT